jgi:succinate dehydrogenase / fumarate reductase, cytochrome b subunit
MDQVLKFYKSTIGKKFIVAVTGLAMVFFLIGHMVGNLKTFMGQDKLTGQYKLDTYAHYLRVMGAELFGDMVLLWIARLGLIAAVILHVVTVVQLAQLNNQARNRDYTGVKYNSATLASRTMYWGGVLIALFIILHLLHFTFGTIHFQGFVHGKVYANVHSAFSLWYVTLFYVICMVAVALHLFRGIASILTAVLFFGFISVPVAIFAGVVPAPIATAPAAAAAQPGAPAVNAH